MEMVKFQNAKREVILSSFIFLTVNLFCQELSYSKYQVGIQVFNESILSNNGIFADKTGQLFDDYEKYLSVNNPIILDQAPRKYLGFSQNKILGNINGGYNFDFNNSLIAYIQFSYRYNLLEFSDLSSTYANSSDYGDLNFNLVYFRNFRLSKLISIKLGIGGGLIFSTTNELNDVYGLTRFSRDIYSAKNAYYFEGNKRVVTTEQLFRNSIDINITPRFQIDFTKERKSYFSFIGGLNIMPFDYLGVQSNVYDLTTKQVTNSLTTKFKNTTLFLGIGYTFGWEQKTK